MQMATTGNAQALQSGDAACLKEQGVNEQELVCAARFGDTHAFSCLVNRYQSLAYNLAYRMLGDSQSAGDAAQDAFLSAYRAIGQHRGQSFKPWILRIVANKCYDRLRYRQRHPEDSLECLSYESEQSAPPDIRARVARELFAPARVVQRHPAEPVGVASRSAGGHCVGRYSRLQLWRNRRDHRRLCGNGQVQDLSRADALALSVDGPGAKLARS